MNLKTLKKDLNNISKKKVSKRIVAFGSTTFSLLDVNDKTHFFVVVELITKRIHLLQSLGLILNIVVFVLKR